LTRDDPSAYVPPPAFGPFRVLHQVGVGALGPVFRTYEPTRDRLVAVKVFRLDIVPEQARSLADALSRASEAGLFHPSIVEPIASGIEGSVAYRAEEYVAAESLDVAMRHYAPAPVEKALPFVTQLAGAIDFARAAGIGHGALHPRDIFITPDEARATGFGVVEALERVGIRAPVRRPYSAPERIEGQPWGVAADVFALAAITFELLTGRRPAGIGTEAGALPEIPHRAAVQSVLSRAMDQEPARRYGTALAFAAALESAWRGEPLDEKPPAAAPGEFAVEERLDPVAAALDDATARLHRDEIAPKPVRPEQTLFDDEHADVDATARHHPSALEATIPLALPLDRKVGDKPSAAVDEARTATSAIHDDHDGGATLALNRPGDHVPDRFAHEFADEQQAEAEQRRTLEAEGASSYPDEAAGFEAPVAPAMFGATDDEPRDHGLFSYIAVAVVGLILGFAAAYFMWGRNVPPSAGTAETSAAASAAPSTPTETPSSPAARPSTEASPSPQTHAESNPPAPPAHPAAAAAAPAHTSAAAAKRGEITVRSTPSKAGVTVNGTWRGRTPLTLDSLAFGKYIVRVIQPDYKTAREEFSLSAESPSKALNVHLESDASPPSRSRAAEERPSRTAETFTGTLFVDSHPQGATVVIDGKPVGKTPLRLNDVRIGTHVVRLELARHRPWFSTARVVAGQELRVAGSLEEIQ
jgi:hypothetical protein